MQKALLNFDLGLTQLITFGIGHIKLDSVFVEETNAGYLVGISTLKTTGIQQVYYQIHRMLVGLDWKTHNCRGARWMC